MISDLACTVVAVIAQFPAIVVALALSLDGEYEDSYTYGQQQNQAAKHFEHGVTFHVKGVDRGFCLET